MSPLLEIFEEILFSVTHLHHRVKVSAVSSVGLDLVVVMPRWGQTPSRVLELGDPNGSQPRHPGRVTEHGVWVSTGSCYLAFLTPKPVAVRPCSPGLGEEGHMRCQGHPGQASTNAAVAAVP